MMMTIVMNIPIGFARGCRVRCGWFGGIDEFVSTVRLTLSPSPSLNSIYKSYNSRCMILQ